MRFIIVVAALLGLSACHREPSGQAACGPPRVSRNGVVVPELHGLAYVSTIHGHQRHVVTMWEGIAKITCDDLRSPDRREVAMQQPFVQAAADHEGDEVTVSNGPHSTSAKGSVVTELDWGPPGSMAALCVRKTAVGAVTVENTKTRVLDVTVEGTFSGLDCGEL